MDGALRVACHTSMNNELLLFQGHYYFSTGETP
jgi:hypothetical protein